MFWCLKNTDVHVQVMRLHLPEIKNCDALLQTVRRSYRQK